MKIKTLCMGVGLMVFLAVFARHMAVAEDLNEAIRYLLAYVKHSGVVFIRNGKEHTAREAEDHMRKKYEHFKDRIKTPEDFIRFAGTKSLLSGKPYRVRMRDGSTMLSQKWLEAILAEYRSTSSGTAGKVTAEKLTP